MARGNAVSGTESAHRLCISSRDPVEGRPFTSASGSTYVCPLVGADWDHVGGNEELKQQTGASVVGPFADKERIPSLDIALADGETWKFGEQDVSVIDTPGHTRGHIAFYLPGAQAVFTGDTLFALGCGRLFEGTAAQMWKSLSQLAELPPETKVYCGHEYTQSNARFALSVDGTNEALIERSAEIDGLRKQQLPTIPTTIQRELETNPFMRAKSVTEFAKIRTAKDNF